MDDKLPQEGRDRGYVTDVNFWSLTDIAGTAESRVVKFCTHVGLGNIQC